MTLDIKKLKKEQREYKRKNHEYYRRVYEIITRRIEDRNEKKYDYVIININPIQMGLPIINIDHAIMYAMMKLGKEGFRVIRINYNSIYCKW